MPRVLHLIDAASRQACPTTLALIGQTLAAERDAEALLLGGRALESGARAAGLERYRRVGVARGHAVLGLAGLRRALNQQDADLIHCWSATAAFAAGILRPRTPRLLSLVQPPHRDALPWLRRAAARRVMRITTLDASLRDRLIDAGLAADTLDVLEPGIDPSLLAATDRVTVRAEWGLDEPDARAIALLSDPPRAGDARRASLALGLAYESLTAALGGRPPIRMLAHPGQHRRASAWRMMMGYGVGGIVGQDARVVAPWQVLPACDGALLLGEHGNGLAIRWAMAAGVPIVAERTPGLETLLENETSALLVEPGQPKRLAHRLHQLLIDPTASRRRADAARALAVERFSPDRYRARIGEIYGRLRVSHR